MVEGQLELAEIEGRRLVLESTHDITERRNWEHRQEMMLAELSHRVKNTLAVVQSFASQSVRSAATRERSVVTAPQLACTVPGRSHAANGKPVSPSKTNSGKYWCWSK